METTSPIFRLRAGFRRGEARRIVLAVRLGAALWRFVFSAARRLLPPNPALICLALRCRLAIFALFRFPLPRLAGFAIAVSRTANAMSQLPPESKRGHPAPGPKTLRQAAPSRRLPSGYCPGPPRRANRGTLKPLPAAPQLMLWGSQAQTFATMVVPEPMPSFVSVMLVAFTL